MAVPEGPLDSNAKQGEQDEAAKSTESRQDIAGQGIAAGEVKAVSAPQQRKSSSRRLLLLLLLVVLAAAGYYFYGDQLLQTGSSLLRAGQQPKPQPKRYAIERRAESAKVVASTAMESPNVSSGQPLNDEPTPETKSPVEPSVVVDNLPELLPPEQELSDVLQPALGAAEKTAVEPSTTENVQPEPIKQVIEKTPDTTVAKDSSVAVEEPVFRILVGPYLTKKNLTDADRRLQELGFAGEVGEGRGPVFLTRLIEGVYPRSQAKQRVQQLRKQFGDAFLLPSAGEWAVCVGSFVDPDRAAQYGKELTQKGITLTTVSQDVEINGKMLIVEQKGKAAAERVAAKLKAAGYRVAVQAQ